MPAETIEQDEETGRSSPLMAIIFVVVAALIAAGAGFGMGQMVFAPMIVAPAPVETPAPLAGGAVGAEDDDAADKPAAAQTPFGQTPVYDYSGLTLVPLDPVTTNIATPANVWVRAEISLAFAGEPDPVLVQQIQSDVLAYLRTVRLHSLSTPSGFQHIASDLRGRAVDRSNGTVRHLFVTALLVE